MKIKTKDIVRIAMVAIIYVAASLAIAPLAFGAIQFRIAEVLVLFVIYNRKYALSLILGCFIVNIFSPLGIIDMIVGTSATALTCLVMMYIKNIYLASIVPTVFCLAICAELYFVLRMPFWITVFTVMIGEFVVVSIFGIILMKIIIRNKNLVAMLGFNRNLPKPPHCEPPPFSDEDKSQYTSTVSSSQSIQPTKQKSSDDNTQVSDRAKISDSHVQDYSCSKIADSNVQSNGVDNTTDNQNNSNVDSDKMYNSLR